MIVNSNFCKKKSGEIPPENCGKCVNVFLKSLSHLSIMQRFCMILQCSFG